MARKYYYKEKSSPLVWDENSLNPLNHWIEQVMTPVYINREDYFLALEIYLITPNRRFFLDRCPVDSYEYIKALENEFPDSIPVVFIHGNHVHGLKGDGKQIDH